MKKTILAQFSEAKAWLTDRVMAPIDYIKGSYAERMRMGYSRGNSMLFSADALCLTLPFTVGAGGLAIMGVQASGGSPVMAGVAALGAAYTALSVASDGFGARTKFSEPLTGHRHEQTVRQNKFDARNWWQP